MKVQITKDFKTAKGRLKVGQIIRVKPFVAQQWQQEGKCKEENGKHNL